MSVLRRNIYIVSRQIEDDYLSSSATGSESSRGFFGSYANDGSKFDDTEGDSPRGKEAPPLTITHWGLRVGRWIYNWVKTNNTSTVEFMRTPTTDAKWDTYFHVGTTSMRDEELLAAALEVGEARSATYRVIQNNCHEFVLHVLSRMDGRSDILWPQIREKIFTGSRTALRTYMHTFFGTYVTLGVVGAVTGGTAVPFLLAMYGTGMWVHGVQNS